MGRRNRFWGAKSSLYRPRECSLVRQDVWRSRVPVVLYHRMNQRERTFSFRLAFRWYKTTGTRLRQTSCRTREHSRGRCGATASQPTR